MHILEKALYELTYELNNRPDWVTLPLTGILQCFDSSNAAGVPGDAGHRMEDGRNPLFGRTAER